MSKEKWTPGPWRYQENSDTYTHIVRAAENTFICQLPQDRNGSTSEKNARLIAAAPELYEWLDACLGLVDGRGPPNWDGIREVLAKARGETP